MKKICFVKYDMRDTSGGARVCANLANALSDRYEVHVVSICGESDDTFYTLSEGVQYSVLIRGSGRIRETIFKGSRLLHAYLKDNGIDMAFAVGVSISPFIVNAVRGTKCKAVTCEHITCLDTFESNFTQRLCRRIGAKLSDTVVTLTPDDREAYIEKYSLSPEKVVSIYNWIDDSLVSEENVYNPKSRIIMSAGRIVPLKGIEKVIEVSRRLKDEFPEWQWHIYGTGEDEYVSKLRGAIEENGLGGFLKLMGGTNDIYSLYKNCGLFVLTSYSEGFSLVLLEAKAHRIPLVSFDCPTGPRNIIRDGVDGYLVQAYDVDALHDKIAECLSDEELRVRLSENAYGNMDKFYKSEIIERWIELIGE